MGHIKFYPIVIFLRNLDSQKKISNCPIVKKEYGNSAKYISKDQSDCLYGFGRGICECTYGWNNNKCNDAPTGNYVHDYTKDCIDLNNLDKEGQELCKKEYGNNSTYIKKEQASCMWGNGKALCQYKN